MLGFLIFFVFCVSIIWFAVAMGICVDKFWHAGPVAWIILLVASPFIGAWMLFKLFERSRMYEGKKEALEAILALTSLPGWKQGYNNCWELKNDENQTIQIHQNGTVWLNNKQMSVLNNGYYSEQFKKKVYEMHKLDEIRQIQSFVENVK